MAFNLSDEAKRGDEQPWYGQYRLSIGNKIQSKFSAAQSFWNDCFSEIEGESPSSRIGNLKQSWNDFSSLAIQYQYSDYYDPIFSYLIFYHYIKRRMSHFIEGVQIGPYEMFSQRPARLFVSPKFKSKFQGIKPLQKSTGRCFEEIMIKNICKRLNDRQFQNLQKENAIYIESQLSKFKEKLRRQANGPKSVASYFDNDPGEDKLNLKEILAKMPQKLYLERKYNTKVMANGQIAKEAENINRYRRDYRSWLDKEKNSPLKSPNYQKMNFVLQKMKNSHQQLPYMKILERDKNKVCMKYESKGYKPKNRRVKTLENETFNRCTQ